MGGERCRVEGAVGIADEDGRGDGGGEISAAGRDRWAGTSCASEDESESEP